MSKANHYKKFSEDNKTKLLKVWGGIKEIIRTKVTSKKTIHSIFANDKITTDASKIANFLMIFIVTPTKIEKQIPNTLRNYKDYLTNPQDSSFFLSATTTSEVESEQKNLKNNKALGPFSIATKLLKTFHKAFGPPLTEFINLSFSNGKFPTILNFSDVIPTFKKGDKSQCNNYRPISLISNLSKIIEKIVYKRLYSFLEEK